MNERLLPLIKALQEAVRDGCATSDQVNNAMSIAYEQGCIDGSLELAEKLAKLRKVAA